MIPSTYDAARAVEQTVLEELDKHGYDEAAAFAVKLALEESLNNAIKHGNGLDPEKTITIEYQVDSEQVRVVIADQGPGFDPADVPDPRADENIEKPCGRGIMLMRAYMDTVCYSMCGNRVEMVKCRCKN